MTPAYEHAATGTPSVRSARTRRRGFGWLAAGFVAQAASVALAVLQESVLSPWAIASIDAASAGRGQIDAAIARSNALSITTLTVHSALAAAAALLLLIGALVLTARPPPPPRDDLE